MGDTSADAAPEDDAERTNLTADQELLCSSLRPYCKASTLLRSRKASMTC
jgi:hypothetical protein